jgi:hypothetical protein
MTHVIHQNAYEAAIERRIKGNANKTRRAAWQAQNPDFGRLIDFLSGSGEFDAHCIHCKKPWHTHLIQTGEYFDIPTDKCRQGQNPVLYSAGKLRVKMHHDLLEWGGLTLKQTDLVRSMLAKAEAKVLTREQDRAVKLAADQAGSQHLGTVGERTTFTMTVERILSFETQFGLTYINLCRSEGSVVVYKGSNRLVDHEVALPAQVTVKATVKAHDYRDGVAQTIISRPKVSE